MLRAARVTAALDQSGTVEYDSRIVATGAAQSYFGHPEFAEFGCELFRVSHEL
jgi:NADH dehydrogenase FAD-containing subunit